MATKYIDLNCGNAIERNKTNNRWKVKTDDLNLPAGTTLQVQNSLINKQGITGQSIELLEDVSETIHFNYYTVDTSHMVPTASVNVGDPKTTTEYKVLVDTSRRFNPDKANPADDLGVINNGYFGFTENIMPLAGVLKTDAGAGEKNYLIPLVGKANIKIPKGTYTVTSLGDLITDQINRVKNPEVEGESGYEERRKNGVNNGTVANNTTLRFVQTLPNGWQENLGGDIPVLSRLYNGGGPPPGPGNTKFTQASLADLNVLPGNRALTVSDNVIPSIVGVTSTHMRDLFYNAKMDNFGNEGADTNGTYENVFGPIPPGSANVPNPKYGILFEADNGGAIDAADGFQRYDLFQVGTQVGTSGLKFDYDADRSGFRFQYLHEPRRIPTHDKRGNQMSNAGQEAVFMKRLPGFYAQGKAPYENTSQFESVWNVTYPYHIPSSAPPTNYTETQVTRLKNTLEAHMTRLSGILVFNWGFETATKLGDAPDLVQGTPPRPTRTNANDFRSFGDFFTSEQKARVAWETTIWFRLGFTYDQLQDESKYQNQNFYGTNETVYGMTTTAKVDTSLAPFVSTLFNDYGKTAPGTTPTNQFRALGDLSNAQCFNLNDVSIANVMYNNNLAIKLRDASSGPDIPQQDKAAAVASYEGSDYEFASMVPATTSSAELLASNLPVLSQDGYMLVLSDIVNQDDEAGKRSELGILDMIPKSSLSNQDFIADRNFITHKLSNPKSLNYINISVVNPDLTDIELQPNSTILLKITKPAEKPTVILAEASVEVATQGVTEKVEQDVQAAAKAGLI